uniref:Uncharacterized protein n=1 Tax=Setaria viridis TaxID=4556 RepID=A0A4U6U7V2_SETVI|nr:hypothetical protein SEVIR_6G158000v2 [Setaria viridis]
MHMLNNFKSNKEDGRSWIDLYHKLNLSLSNLISGLHCISQLMPYHQCGGCKNLLLVTHMIFCTNVNDKLGQMASMPRVGPASGSLAPEADPPPAGRSRLGARSPLTSTAARGSLCPDPSSPRLGCGPPRCPQHRPRRDGEHGGDAPHDGSQTAKAPPPPSSRPRGSGLLRRWRGEESKGEGVGGSAAWSPPVSPSVESDAGAFRVCHGFIPAYSTYALVPYSASTHYTHLVCTWNKLRSTEI